MAKLPESKNITGATEEFKSLSREEQIAQTSRGINELAENFKSYSEPVATKTKTESTSSPYYSRYNNGSLNETPSVKVKTAEQLQKEMTLAAQGEINALGEYYNSRLEEQRVINEKNDRSTASISTLTGLAGSSEANLQQQKTTEIGQKANQKIKEEAALRVQTLLGNIRQSALTEARALREEARLDEETRIKNRTARQQEAVTNLTNLSAGGVTFDGLREGDPDSFKYLSEQFGGEEALRGAFILNTPQDQILDKRVEGGKYVIAKQNPLTGKVSIESIDLGIPVGYSKTIDAGNRILAVPDDWDGDPSKLVTINKGLTPEQQRKASETGPSVGANISEYPEDIQSAAQSILDGRSKLNEYPSAKRLQINSAMSKIYRAEGGNELAQGAYDAILALEKHPGFNEAVGTNALFGFGKNISGTDSAGFIAELDKFKANIKLVNIKYLKGTGALSDAEGKTLEDAGTSLNPKLPERDFKNELTRVKKALEKANKFTNETTGDPEEQELLNQGYTPEQIKQLKEAK